MTFSCDGVGQVNEASDETAIQNNFDALNRTLLEHKKEAKSIRYDRAGGHNLFHSAGYYLQDVKAFLNQNLGGQ
jgi:hypothetical protein